MDVYIVGIIVIYHVYNFRSFVYYYTNSQGTAKIQSPHYAVFQLIMG